MCHLVEHEDGHHLNDVGSQEAIPYPFFSKQENNHSTGMTVSDRAKEMKSAMW